MKKQDASFPTLCRSRWTTVPTQLMSYAHCDAHHMSRDEQAGICASAAAGNDARAWLTAWSHRPIHDGRVDLSSVVVLLSRICLQLPKTSDRSNTAF